MRRFLLGTTLAAIAAAIISPVGAQTPSDGAPGRARRSGRSRQTDVATEPLPIKQRRVSPAEVSPDIERDYAEYLLLMQGVMEPTIRVRRAEDWPLVKCIRDPCSPIPSTASEPDPAFMDRLLNRVGRLGRLIEFAHRRPAKPSVFFRRPVGFAGHADVILASPIGREHAPYIQTL